MTTLRITYAGRNVELVRVRHHDQAKDIPWQDIFTFLRANPTAQVEGVLWEGRRPGMGYSFAKLTEASHHLPGLRIVVGQFMLSDTVLRETNA